MAGGVGGGVPLDRDLGNVLDMMVNLVSDMMDNRGSGNGDWSSMDNWGNMSICCNGGSMSIGGNWSGMSNSCNGCSMSIGGNSRSSNGMYSRVNTSYKTMSISSSYKTMSNSSNETMSNSSNETMSISTSKVLSISISNWGSKATTNKSSKNSKALHLESVE